MGTEAAPCQVHLGDDWMEMVRYYSVEATQISEMHSPPNGLVTLVETCQSDVML